MFTEGWVEFTNKKLAKKVALSLNNTQIGGKRRSRWFDEIWNIKYLPKFKWGHLNERLAYERAVHQQRMRAEISQVKKESNFYIQNVEKNERLKKVEKKLKKKQSAEGTSAETSESVFGRDWDYQQRQTDQEKVEKRKRKLQEDDTGQQKKRKEDSKKRDISKASQNKSFLKSLFSGGVAVEESDQAS